MWRQNRKWLIRAPKSWVWSKPCSGVIPKKLPCKSSFLINNNLTIHCVCQMAFRYLIRLFKTIWDQTEPSNNKLVCNWYRPVIVTAWTNEDPTEHSFSYTSHHLIMHKIRIVGTRRYLITDWLINYLSWHRKMFDWPLIPVFLVLLQVKLSKWKIW